MIVKVARSAMAAIVLAVVVVFTGAAQASPIAGQASALVGKVGQAPDRMVQHVQFRRGGGFRRGGFRRGFRGRGFRGRGFRGRGFRRGFRGRGFRGRGFRGRGFRGRGFARRGGFRRGFRGRGFRRGFRGRRFGTGFGVGFGTGVFFGSAIAASSFRGSDFAFTDGACGKFGIGSADYNFCCSQKYKSFNPETGRYLAYSGRYRVCK